MNFTRWHIPLMCAALFLGSVNAWADPLDVWHWRNPLPQGDYLSGVAYGNGLYVAVGLAGTVLTSTNAEAWDVHPLAIHSWLTDIIFAADQFVVAGGDGIWTSPTGTSWVNRRTDNLSAVIYANNLYVAVGRFGTILISPDGITWSDCASGTTEDLNGIAYANGTFVAVGGYYTNSAILISQDGINWTNRTISSDSLNGVAYGNGVFVAVGSDFYGEVDVSLISADGINWARHTITPRSYPWSVCFDQRIFVTAGSPGISTSPDGVTWTNRYSEENYSSLSAVRSVGAQFVAVGNAGGIVTSVNGIDWTRRTIGTTLSIYSVAYGHNAFVGVGNQGLISTSQNGVEWLHRKSPGIDWFQDITFGEGLFVATGRSNQQTMILTSKDGVAWSQQQLSISTTIYSITYGAGIFAVAGGSDNGQGGVILTSTNATNWLARSVPTTSALYAVTSGNGLLVAVGARGTIVTSSDGLTWIVRTSGVTNGLYAVGYGNGTFVTADSRVGPMTSTDGISWIVHPASGRGFYSFYGITFGNGIFVAASGNGVATSTNGVSWALRSLPTSDRLNDVIYAQNRFTVVGEWGILLQSGYFGSPLISGLHQVPGGLGFSAQGEAGRNYRIQANTNLAPDKWIDLFDFTAGETATPFLDSPGSFPQRFYRLRQLP